MLTKIQVVSEDVGIWDDSWLYTVESRYNAVVGVQETGPRYKWIAL